MPISPHRRSVRADRDAIRIYGGARTLQRGNEIQASRQGNFIIGDPYNNTVANQVGMVWDQSAGSLMMKNSSLEVYNAGLQTIDIKSTGISKWGSNLAAAATTTFAIFTTGDTYNSESMGAGDLLIGDNTTGGTAANVFWDASAKDLLLREGITKRIILGSDGNLTIQRTATTTSADSVHNMVTRIVANPGANSSAWFYSIEAQAYSTAGNVRDINNINSFYPTTSHQGTGTVATMESVYGDCYNTTGGTVTDAVSGRFSLRNTGAGEITGGAVLETLLVETAGEIVTGYDVRMKSSTAQATTQWGIYQDNANPSWLAGGLWVGGSEAAAPTGQIAVHQNNTAGAAYTVRMIQADVNVAFMQFQGTSADGVLTNSLVEYGDEGSTTTAGYIRIRIDDVGNQITDQSYYIPFYTLNA